MNPFLDPLQEAVAGNRAWADALAAALRGAGENMGFVPSEEKRRLTEEAKSVMPQMADPAKQELARQLMMGFGTGNLGMAGITVHHGTPHTFPPVEGNPLGAFNPAKIGSGEGSAAFGRGTYVAENPQVAHGYKPEFEGSLYKADLPDEHLPNMLHWDKPLTEQPQAVIAALQKGGVIGELKPADKWAMGEDIWNILASKVSSSGLGPEKAAEFLQSLGIPGIRYLDRGSRSAGEGTSNYVLFDPSIANIIGRE